MYNNKSKHIKVKQTMTQNKIKIKQIISQHKIKQQTQTKNTKNGYK